jgi:uncharacterized membrane protein YphA (DoxX/SURF4 family)
MTDPGNQQLESYPMPVGKFFAIGLPIALGVVMIGAGAVNFVGPRSVRDSFIRWGYPAGFHRMTGGLEVVAGLLLLVPATWWAGAIGSVVILLAAATTLIRCREWSHLPGAVVLIAASVGTLAIHG